MKNIYIFKLFYHVGGEFPLFKFIGFRRLFCKHEWAVISGVDDNIITSGRNVSPSNLIVMQENKERLVDKGLQIYKRARFSIK